jgi:hypothetical protein
MEEEGIEELESFANVSIAARLDSDQYAVLVTCMAQWTDEHPDEAEAIQTLKSIEFVRER